MSLDVPQIENQTGKSLPEPVLRVLREMFADYIRIVVKSELGSGLSDARVFLVRPVRKSGAELPGVVKVGPVTLIDQEWQAYRRFIYNQLPDVAQIKEEPVYPPGSLWGGLHYPLVGSREEMQVESLREYSRHASVEDLRYVLENRLLSIMRQNWQNHEMEPELSLGDSYDVKLPVNLFLVYRRVPAGETSHWLIPENLSFSPYEPGSFVAVRGFRVVEIDKEDSTLTFDLPVGVGKPYASYRLRMTAVPQIDAYEVGQIIHDPLTAVVKDNRFRQLHTLVQRVMGAGLDLDAATIPVYEGSPLVNPLSVLADTLNHSLDVRLANIHGDLNLENILVEYDQRTLHVYLIDFALARRDHVLHDLVHLETNIILHLLPEFIPSGSNPPRTIYALYKRLHRALVQTDKVNAPASLEKPFAMLLSLRTMAAPYLFQRGRWDEYYRSLLLSTLGAQKFRNISQQSARIAFWVAAVVETLRQYPPTCRRSDEKTIQREVNVSKKSHRRRYNDIYTRLEIRLEILLEELGPNHELYGEAELIGERLTSNINAARRFGDTETRRSERTEVVDQLNRLATEKLGTSFMRLDRRE